MHLTIKDNTSPILTWTTHRLKIDPWRLVVVIPSICAAAWAGAALYGLLGGLAAGGVVIAAVSEYLFPVHHTLTSEKATVQCFLSRSEILWSNVKHAWLTDEGIKLSPLPGRSRREAYRGVFLRFSEDKQPLLQTVRQQIPIETRANERTSRFGTAE